MKKTKISGFKNEILYSYTDLKTIIYKEDIYVTDIGYFPKAEYHYISRSNGANENILIFCKEGSGKVIINYEEYLITHNCFIIIPAHMQHYYSSNKNNPWSIYWMHFHDNIIHEIKTYQLLDTFHYTFIQYLFSNMINSLEQRLPDVMIYVNKNARLLLTSLEFYIDTQIKRNNNLPEFDKFDDYINININKRITLNDLSAFSNYSYSHINKVFKAKHNIAPIDYIIKKKLVHSCILLQTTHLNITEVALKVGYEDSLYFSRVFKSRLGVSPKHYRENKMRIDYEDLF